VTGPDFHSVQNLHDLVAISLKFRHKDDGNTGPMDCHRWHRPLSGDDLDLAIISADINDLPCQEAEAAVASACPHAQFDE
jgi:hypothetical protein